MPYKLLLADDSVTIQRVIELTFADEDVQVKAVGDGQQAIDQILAEPPDIVLADVGMPVRDGYAVAAFIKDTPSLEHIPVLLLTGAFEPVDEDRARAVRCNGVLAKPFEPQLLIGRVKSLLGGVTPSPSRQPDAPEPAAAMVPVTLGPTGNSPLVAVPKPESIEIDDDATVRLTRPSEPPADEDLRLDVASLEVVREEPAPAADSSLNDYFDRLDAAFAHLTGGQPGKEGQAAPRPQPADPWEAAARTTPEWPPVRAAAPLVGDIEDLDPDRPRPEVFGPGPDYGATSSPGDDLAAAASSELPVSEAFLSLLDAEHEHGADVVHHGDARSGAAVTLPGTAVTASFIDDVARRVMERLGDSAFREAIADAVSSTAERLVREEIERIKSSM